MVGLIGVGRWGRNLARNFRELGALTALCDHHPATLRDLERESRDVRLYRCPFELIRDPDIRAVAIATRADSHFALAKAAIESGKDVYCEKPLCLNLTQARELYRLSADLGRILMVGHLLHYHSAIQELKRLLSNGDLGRVLYVNSNRLNLGVIGMEGSALWDLAPHDISIILSLFSGKRLATVRCFGGAFIDHNALDLGVLSLDFGDGTGAHVHFSWLHPYKDHRLTVIGSEGMAVFDDLAPWERKLQLYHGPVGRDADGKAVAVLRDPHFVQLPIVEPLKQECAHFLECCRSRCAPLTDGAEALGVLSVLTAAHESLEQEGERVAFDYDFFEKNLDFRASAVPL